MPLNLHITAEVLSWVMTCERTNGNEVSCAQGAVGSIGEVSLRDFFNNGLGHGVNSSRSGERVSPRASFGTGQYARLHAALLGLGTGRIALACTDFALTSDSIRDISSLTEPTCSRFQIASFTLFCARSVSTPSASAENFSSTS